MADQISNPRVRAFRPQAGMRERTGPGYEIRPNAAPNALHGSDADAEIYLYDPIGGWWGIEASDFVRDLMALDADRIDLHINSPGGSAYDGLAMYQALRNHRARITVYVDGLAASAASFVAMAGDRRICAPHATVMIHEPWGLCIGDAADMDKARQELDKLADNNAALYARRAGGDAADWREAMREESWYTAEEAVAAGLMHEVQEDSEKTGTADGEDQAQARAARWDIAGVFAYAGRSEAPAPRLPHAAASPTGRMPHAADPQTDKPPAAEPDRPSTEEDRVSELNAEARQWLGLADDADDDAIVAAVKTRQAEHDALTAKVADLEAAKAAAEAKAAQQEQTSAALTEKVAQLDELVKDQGTELAQIRADKAAATKAAVLDGAQSAGKFAPADREKWSARYDKSADVTTEVLASIPAGSAVPVQPVGHTGPAEPDGTEGSDADWDKFAADLYGPADASNASKGA